MAANKFATKLNRGSHKIVVILVYVVLEWVLIALLLFNSLLYYFIKKFASFFGLKPTCLWCSSVDCLFESGVKDASYEGLFCEDHTSKISKIGYCLAHKKLVETQSRCQECSQGTDESEKELSCSCCGKSLKSDQPHLMINGLLDVVAKESVRIEEIEEEDQDINVSIEEPQILSDVGSFYLQEAAEEDSSRSTSNSLCNENEGIEDEEDARGVEVDESEDAEEEEKKEIKHVEIEKEEVGGKESSVSCESDLKLKDIAIGYEEVPIGDGASANEALNDHPGEKHNEETRSILENGREENQSLDNGCDPSVAIEWLRSELESERKAHKDVSVELEAERNAAAIAANQTMAMITRLQEEKAVIKMEAVQYQRMMEEQAEYDQEALQLLNELVIKREKEKQELEKELEVYRDKVLEYEMIKEKALSLRKSGCSSSSCSLNDDSDKLSIDLNKEAPSTGAVLDSVDMVLDRVKNWNMLDGSLEEFEEERLSILNQLKELEEKLFSVCDDDQEEGLVFEDVKPIEHFLEQQEAQENANLCSAEVNLVPTPTTMASAAKKLLPLLEKEDGDGEQKAREVDTNDKVLAVMKEMDHVYGRLQALEADREFLRHCIGSLNKGDKGAGLLEEILQHLRELRNADTCELMICHE